ncbi:hypothetical protein FN976_25605 [Caenimonas sedimenti]|uniref:Uncharacterized protein n=1 Tax=Caenimonas sedimenti TaxID=2596921 RepID=A0A562ZHU5_9BURK|nr:hypothetical protein [Caenimonas sedimenti]TWO67764.1 hypothetical protein FN976_25605 [Caenimonas sedimenti]
MAHDDELIDTDKSPDQVELIDIDDWEDWPSGWAFLEELLKSVRISRLVLAIERYGIHGHDRFGIIRDFAPGSPQAMEAIDILYDQRSAPQGHFVVGIEDFGWPADKVPDFSRIRQAGAVARSKSGATKHENSLLAMFTALVFAWEGRLGNEPHPTFKRESDIARLLDDFQHQYPGCSKSNVHKMFRRGVEMFGEPRLKK